MKRTNNTIMFFGIITMAILAFARPAPNAKGIPRLPGSYDYPIGEVMVIVDTPEIVLPTSTIDSYRKNQAIIIKNIEKAKKDNKQISKSIDENLENLSTIHKYVAKKDSLLDSIALIKADSVKYPPSKHSWIYNIFHK